MVRSQQYELNSFTTDTISVQYIPFFSVDQRYRPKASIVFHLACDWLWSLNATLGDVKWNVYNRGQRASYEAYQ